MTGFEGRRVLVTGGASGIGRACAEAFAAHGATVVVADVDADEATATAQAIGGEAWPVDLADTAALADLSLDVDVLVNNAGIQHVRPIEDFEPDRFSLILRIMLEAPCAANASAQARPIPLAPPVTTTRRPSNPVIGSLLHLVVRLGGRAGRSRVCIAHERNDNVELCSNDVRKCTTRSSCPSAIVQPRRHRLREGRSPHRDEGVHHR